jgi:hypothetical protein
LLGYTLPELARLELTDVTWLTEDELSPLLSEAAEMNSATPVKPRRHEAPLRLLDRGCMAASKRRFLEDMLLFHQAGLVCRN